MITRVTAFDSGLCFIDKKTSIFADRINAELTELILFEEQKSLVNIFDGVFYAEIHTELAKPNPEQKWLDLRDKIENMIKYFVFINYLRKIEQQNTPIGVVSITPQNVVKTDKYDKLLDYYNLGMVQMRLLKCYLDGNKSIFPNYKKFIEKEKMNRFNL